MYLGRKRRENEEALMHISVCISWSSNDNSMLMKFLQKKRWISEELNSTNATTQFRSTEAKLSCGRKGGILKMLFLVQKLFLWSSWRTYLLWTVREGLPCNPYTFQMHCNRIQSLRLNYHSVEPTWFKQAFQGHRNFEVVALAGVI